MTGGEGNKFYYILPDVINVTVNACQGRNISCCTRTQVSPAECAHSILFVTSCSLHAEPLTPRI